MTLFTVFGVVTLNGYHLTFSPFSLIVDYFVIKAGLDSFNEHAYTKNLAPSIRNGHHEVTCELGSLYCVEPSFVRGDDDTPTHGRCQR